MATKNELAIKIEKKIEIPMIILALLIIPLVLLELEIVPTNPYVVSCATMIDDAIWFAFLFEYLILVSLYDDKVGYTKRNALNLIIIIITPPLISPEGFALIRSLRALRILRFFRALRVLRVVIALQKGIKPLLDMFVKNSLHYVTLLTLVIIIIAGIAFSWVEGQDVSINGIIRGIWWATTTVTTVGYGDLYPESHTGRLLAGILMIIGIGFVALLTANIASYFVEKDKEKENGVQEEDKKDENQLILERLEELSKKIDEINRRLH